MIWGCMSFKKNKGDGNHYLNNQCTFDDFLIPLTEIWCGENEVIFQDNNGS